MSSIAIGPTFMHEGPGMDERPWPLKSFYSGPLPIYEILHPAPDTKPEAPAGKPCRAYKADRVPWGRSELDFVYWIDEQDHIPIRIVAYDDPSARAADRPVWDWNAQRVDHVQGRAVAVESEMRRYQSGDGSLRSRTHFQVERIGFDTSQADYEFKPVFGPGVTVFDTLAKRDYTIPLAKGEAKPAAARQPAIVANPITAGAVAARSPILPVVLFSVGVALLVAVALTLIARRRLRS